MSLSRLKLLIAGTSSPFLSSPAKMPGGAYVVIEMPQIHVNGLKT